MSVWTHVAATIRFDDIRVLGMTKLKPDLNQDIPEGSEGALDYYTWINPEKAHAAAYTTMIWGDLRDYDSVDKVIEYLNRVTAEKLVRQGIAEIHVEYHDPVVVRFNCDAKCWSPPMVAATAETIG